MGLTVQHFIRKHENDFLSEVLGLDLYAAMEAAMLIDPLAQRFIDLRDGKVYTDQYGKTRKWAGLVEDKSNKVSIIANYVYYWYQRNKHTATLSTGEQKTTNENSIPVTAGQKMVDSWNMVSRRVQELWYFLQNNKEFYSEWDSANVCMTKFRTINLLNI